MRHRYLQARRFTSRRFRELAGHERIARDAPALAKPPLQQRAVKNETTSRVVIGVQRPNAARRSVYKLLATVAPGKTPQKRGASEKKRKRKEATRQSHVRFVPISGPVGTTQSGSLEAREKRNDQIGFATVNPRREPGARKFLDAAEPEDLIRRMNSTSGRERIRPNSPSTFEVL